MLNEFFQPFVRNSIEKATNVCIKHPVHLPPLNSNRQRIQRIMCTALRSKPIGKAFKVGLVDRFQYFDHGPLDNFVFQCRDSYWALPAILFWDTGPLDRLGSVRSALQPSGKIPEVVLQLLPVLLPRLPVYPGGRLAFKTVISLTKTPDIVNVMPERGEPQFPIPLRCLPYPSQRILQV